MGGLAGAGRRERSREPERLLANAVFAAGTGRRVFCLSRGALCEPAS